MDRDSIIAAGRSWRRLLLCIPIGLAAGCGAGGSDDDAPPPSRYDISATVTGLSGAGLSLQNNLAGGINVAASGTIAIASDVVTGTAYSVTVLTLPAGLNCVVTNGTGSVAAADVTNVQVTCSAASAGGSLGGVVSAEPTFSSSIALDNAGTLWSWGFNLDKVLGLGLENIEIRSRALAIPIVVGVTQVSASPSHVLARRGDGTVLAWGNNDNGQVGDGTSTDRAAPVQVSGLTNVQAVSAGLLFSVALRSDGTVWAWGNGSYTFGSGSPAANQLVPVQAPGVSGITAISAGGFHVLALKSDGTVWSWGSISYSGRPYPPGPHSTPAQIPTLQNIIAVQACSNHSMVLRSDGTVWAWGSNNVGQLGNGTTADVIGTMVQVGLTQVAELADCNGQSSIAIRSDRTVWAWGGNNSGQLGDGSAINRLSPVQITLPGAVRSVAAGATHSMAVLTDGSLYAWGDGSGGKLGTGNLDSSLVPVRVLKQ